MSIWTRDIFGERVQKTPPSERAIRCARLRDAADVDVVRLLPLCIGVGVSLFAIPMYVDFLVERAQVKVPQPSVAAQVWQDWAKALPIVLPGFGLMILMYWVIPVFARWMFDSFAARQLTAEYLRRRRRRRAWFKSHMRKIVVLIYAMFALVVVTASFDRMKLGMLALLLAFGSCWSGVLAIGTGLTARRGRGLVCGRCDHGMRSCRSAAEKCSECGCEWKRPWGARMGARRIWWKQVWIGVGMLLLAIVIMWVFAVMAWR